MKSLLKSPKAILKTLAAGAFVCALFFSFSSDAYAIRTKWQGPYTGNCYCDISGSDCECVFTKEEIQGIN